MDRDRKPGKESAGYSHGLATPEMTGLEATAPGGTVSLVENDPARLRTIARIREALANGSYTVRASDVAGKLMEHMRGR